MNRRLISPTFETHLFCIRSAFNKLKHIKRVGGWWVWMADRADGQSGGWVVCWVGDLLGGWLVGWLVGWVGGQLDGWLVRWWSGG